VLETLALVTCDPVPEGADESSLEAGLLEAGVAFRWVAWDDPTTSWANYDAVLIRTTWDYHHRLAEFLAWADRVEQVTRLVNPASVLRWNSHKGYLLELEGAGVAVIPSVVVPRSAGTALVDVVGGAGWSLDADVVVKPAVSVGSLGAERGLADDARVVDAFRTLVESGDTLVQPFLPEVVSTGETSTVFVAGGVSHALVKVPARGDYRSQPEWGGQLRGIDPPAACIELGAAAIRVAEHAVGSPIFYARVDTIELDGSPRLIELELIEPDLFYRYSPPGAAVALGHALQTLLHDITGPVAR